MEREELAAWLRLTLTPGIGNEAARKLLAAFGPPEAVFAQSATALRQVVSALQTSALQNPPDTLGAQTQTTLDWLAAGDHRQVLPLGAPGYPQALLQIEDPPLVLYALGNHPLNSTTPALAMVGSRNPTPQGAANARQFARSFSDAGLTIVSGLALGVDGAAHTGALEGPSPTVAVVGTGLDKVYPKQHLELAHRIAARGVIVSEFPLGTPPLSHNFPKRNRIISGLSQGTLVVEAALQSGSLITARLAIEQGKDVFAIPGSIHAAQSRGCHALLKQGAKLVESAQDVLEELRLFAPEKGANYLDKKPDTGTNDAENGLLVALGHDPVSLDALQARTGLPTASLQGQLLELELAGQVARLPGGLFQRLSAG